MALGPLSAEAWQQIPDWVLPRLLPPVLARLGAATPVLLQRLTPHHHVWLREAPLCLALLQRPVLQQGRLSAALPSEPGRQVLGAMFSGERLVPPPPAPAPPPPAPPRGLTFHALVCWLLWRCTMLGTLAHSYPRLARSFVVPAARPCARGAPDFDVHPGRAFAALGLQEYLITPPCACMRAVMRGRAQRHVPTHSGR